MAVMWQKQANGVLYEVRTAGESRRLYTDGVFHSQYNPKQILTGGVWDLLMLPAFFYQPHEIKNVLVLGVAGGAVIHQMIALREPASITGIELSPYHIQIAKRHFDLNYPQLELHCDEAKSWLKSYRGPKFDMIVEDLFIENDGEPQRAITIDSGWMNLLNRNLTSTGVLVMNCIENSDLRQIKSIVSKFKSSRFQSAYRFETSNYGNMVVALSRQKVSAKLLRKNLETQPLLDTMRAKCRLDYTVTSLGRLTV